MDVLLADGLNIPIHQNTENFLNHVDCDFLNILRYNKVEVFSHHFLYVFIEFICTNLLGFEKYFNLKKCNKIVQFKESSSRANLLRCERRRFISNTIYFLRHILESVEMRNAKWCYFFRFLRTIYWIFTHFRIRLNVVLRKV